MEDRQIIDLFWKRDEKAVEMTRAAYGFRLESLARRILDSREDAEEILQDTLFRLWKNIPPARPVSLAAYASVICRNLALNRLEKRRSQKRNAQMIELTKELEESIPGSSVEAVVEENELARLLSEALRTLSKEDQWIFVHRYVYFESVRELAEQCDCSSGVIRRRLLKIQEAIRKKLNQQLWS